jgi:hypothetical protein
MVTSVIDELRNEGVVERIDSPSSPGHSAQPLGGAGSYAGALRAFEFEMGAGVHDGAEITCIPWLVPNRSSHSCEHRPPASCLSHAVFLYAAALHFILQILSAIRSVVPWPHGRIIV